MKVKYCCRWPNYSHFEDTNGGKITAVVFCDRCQRICSEIWIKGEVSETILES